MPNCIVHLYHHALRHGESNIVLFPSPFQHQVPRNRNSLFDIQQGDSPALPIPNDLQSICHIVLIPNIFQSAHCKCQIPCKVCNTHLPYIHTSINPDLFSKFFSQTHTLPANAPSYQSGIGVWAIRITARIAPTNAAAPMIANTLMLSFFFAALPISAAQAMQTAAATSAMPSVSHSQDSSYRILMCSSSPVR